MNTLACEKNPRIFSVVSFPLTVNIMFFISTHCTMYITVIRQISYETRLKIDTVPLHPTVYTYKTK